MKLLELKKRADAFDQLFDSVVITDTHGVITDWNKASEKLFGHSKAAAIGQPVNILHVPEDSEKVTLSVISAMSKSGCWSGNVRSLHKDGKIGWVESKCVALYDDDREVIGTLGINRVIPNPKI